MKNELKKIEIPAIEKNLPYFSVNYFSMHQLIEHLINKMPTSAWSVLLSSFSITEEAVRMFYRLKEEHRIKDLSGLFDFNVQRHKNGLLFFSSHIFDKISITKCHAKIVLMYNENDFLSIVSSANLNINDKIEAGIISHERSIFDFYYKELQSAIEKGIIINTRQ